MHAHIPWKPYIYLKHCKRNITSFRIHCTILAASSEGVQYTQSPSPARQLLALWYSPSQPLQVWNPAFWRCSAQMASIPSSSLVSLGKYLPRQCRSPCLQSRLATLPTMTGLFLQLQVSKFWFVNLGIHLRLQNFSCCWFKLISQRCTLLYLSPKPFTLCDFENSSIDWHK